MPTIIGINGILSKGNDSTDLVLDDLRNIGWRAIDYNYPVRGIIDSYFPSKLSHDAQGLIKLHMQGDHIIAHSYGCLVTLEAMRQGARFGHVFFFGAASTSDDSRYFPMGSKSCTHLHVIFNRYDYALYLGAKLPFNPFGHLGVLGYRGVYDPRVINIPAHKRAWRSILNHSLHLTTARKVWVQYIEESINETS